MDKIFSVIDLTCELIKRRSITPNDAGCQELLADILKAANFTIENFPKNDVKNLWASHGNSGPVFAFIGHTDVVPVGDESQWRFSPFAATIENQILYGRGAADMKSGVAAMTIAASRFVKDYPDHPGTIALLITSDEEGRSIDGTKYVIEKFIQEKRKIDFGLVGEATSDKQLGDCIRIGRRGSLTAKIIIQGKQGHVAYPELANNPIHQIVPVLQELIQTDWDEKNPAPFPATSFQISNICAGTGATNVIPGKLEWIANWRFSTACTIEKIQQKLEAILKKNHCDYQMEWYEPSKPYLTQPGKFIDTVVNLIKQQLKISPELSTGGGTSDGRFVAQMGAEVIELGVQRDSCHQINEQVELEETVALEKIYYAILEKMFIK